MIKAKIIKITKIIQWLEFIVLLGSRKALLVLLATVCLSVSSVSNVFATDAGDASIEVRPAPDVLPRALQTTNINNANPTTETNLSANGINTSARVNTNSIIKEKIPQIINITNAPINSAANGLDNNAGRINSTQQSSKEDLDILLFEDTNEKELSRQNQSSNLNNSSKATNKINEPNEISETSRTSKSSSPVQGRQQEAPKVPKSAVEIKPSEAVAATAAIKTTASGSPDNQTNPINLTKPIPDVNEQLAQSDSKVEKLVKPAVKKAKPAAKGIKKIKKIKKIEKTKSTRAKKKRSSLNTSFAKDADTAGEEIVAQYSTESFSQELESSLSSGGSSNKSGAILFAENEQIRVNLSNRDINRLSVADDKIQSINGPAGLYTAKNDPLGSVYIGVNADKSFTLFASTVKGHQFSLFVTPKTSAGKTVVLTPSMPSRMTAQWEAAEGYQKVIVSLISSMINNEQLQDYAYVLAKRPKAYNFYGIAQIKPIGYYLGANLIGSISIIKNTTGKPLSIKPSSFYVPGVRAVALSDQTLAPRASGLLYQVFNR